MPAGEVLDHAGRRRLEHAVAVAEQFSGLTFSVFVGAGDGPTRDFAERLHAALAAPENSVLVFCDPAAHVLEIVTGTALRLLFVGGHPPADGLVAALDGLAAALALSGRLDPTTVHPDRPVGHRRGAHVALDGVVNSGEDGDDQDHHQRGADQQPEHLQQGRFHHVRPTGQRFQRH